MRIVYLDESGLANPEQEPWLVIAGPIVHGDHQLNQLKSALREISYKHLPQNLPDVVTLHAGDIYGGYGKYFDKRRNPEWVDVEKRFTILDDLAQLPERLNLFIAIGFVERAKVFENLPGRSSLKPKELLAGQHAVTYMTCLMEVDHWFRQNRNQENCMVILEDNRDSKTMIKSVHQYNQDPTIAASMGAQWQAHFPLRHIQEDPAFQPKRPSHPLVLADFVAFVSKRMLMGDQHIRRFFEPWKGRQAAKFVDKHAVPGV